MMFGRGDGFSQRPAGAQKQLVRQLASANSSLRRTRRGAHHRHFAALLAGSNPQLADGGLGDFRPLLGFVQLVLDLPEPDGAAAHLLLLADKHGNNNCCVEELWPISGLNTDCYYYYYYYTCIITVTCYFHTHIWLINTHCILSLSFVAFDFGLEFINQILHPKQSLVVLIRLQGEVQQRSIKTHRGWKQDNIRMTQTEEWDACKPGTSTLCTSSRIDGLLSGTPRSSSAPPSARSGAPSPGHVCTASHKPWFPNS